MHPLSLASQNPPAATNHLYKIAARVLLLLFLACITTTPTTRAEEPKQITAATASSITTSTNSPWNRIIMIGASASAGFVESEPLGGPLTPKCRLSRYLDAALVAPHDPITNLATALFFLQPEVEGRRQIILALKSQPTLLVGVDFLFWYCYGEGTDEERAARFERGLKLLETVSCPIILGDIPDVAGASISMLDPVQIPGPRALAAANRRLKEWAASRPQVSVLSLSGFMSAAKANRALTIHGDTLPDGKTAILLQSDRLHPSPPGCAVLAVAILDTFQQTHPQPVISEVHWNPKEVFHLVIPASPVPTPK
ncbi:MAG: hypothetical protein JWR26_3661 [Pedosphaera sp.]|nr:hypothetical protein [Pedosphaera sp.]